MTRRSSHLPRCDAAITPSGSATMMVSAMVHRASARVGPMRMPIICRTGVPDSRDTPRSPRINCPIQDANWAGMDLSSPRVWRTFSSCAPVASSPAKMAAGSPGVSRSMANTTTATMSITGSVASNPRPMYLSVPMSFGRFLDVPKHSHRRLQHAADRRAVCRWNQKLAQWRDHAVVDHQFLEFQRNGLAFGQVGGANVALPQNLDRRNVGPASPGFPAVRSYGRVGHWIAARGQQADGGEDVPAALLRRFLIALLRHHGLPVHGLHLDLEARLAQGRANHDRLGRHDGDIRRLQHYDRHAVVAALFQKGLGLVDVGRNHPFGAVAAAVRMAATK